MISILIRNKNEANLLEKTLKSIHNQHFNIPFEIVVVDNNSTDNSIEVANNYGCKVVHLDKAFTYGYALNFGVKHCQYGIVLLLSSHNILISNDFPDKLIEYFIDTNVAGVRCTPIANTKQIEQSIDGFLTIDLNNYSHSRDWQNLLIANCSAIRKEVVLQIPFNETIRSNEEKLWSLDVLKKGFKIVSNVPCYYLYNKTNTDAALFRDLISKYQIDGIRPCTIGSYLIILIKSFPWAIKIAFKTWYRTIKSHTLNVLIPINHHKSIYK